MRRFDWVFRPLAVVLLLVLRSAPMMDALPHGPGALAAEADHAAWHAKWARSGRRTATSITTPPSTTVIILASHANEAFDLTPAIELNDLPAQTGAIRDGPGRPPREGI